jgi:dGTPase
VSVLKGTAAQYVMRAADRVSLMGRQREVLAELVEALLDAGPGALEPAFRADLEDADSEAARLRVVIDQVASLTDASAAQWHDRLVRSRG